MLTGDGDLVRTLLVHGLGDFSRGGDAASGLTTGAGVSGYGALPRTLFLFSKKRARDAFLARGSSWHIVLVASPAVCLLRPPATSIAGTSGVPELVGIDGVGVEAGPAEALDEDATPPVEAGRTPTAAGGLIKFDAFP